MASGKSKTIEEIDDLWDMDQVMEALGISREGCQTLDEMKARVKTELKESVEEPCWTAGKVRTLWMEYIKNKFETGNVGDFVWFAINHSKPFIEVTSYNDSPVLKSLAFLLSSMRNKFYYIYIIYAISVSTSHH